MPDLPPMTIGSLAVVSAMVAIMCALAEHVRQDQMHPCLANSAMSVSVFCPRFVLISWYARDSAPMKGHPTSLPDLVSGSHPVLGIFCIYLHRIRLWITALTCTQLYTCKCPGDGALPVQEDLDRRMTSDNVRAGTYKA